MTVASARAPRPGFALPRDAEVLAALHDPGFVADWERLHAGRPWASSCQSSAFAAAWYPIHRSTHEPLLAVARAADG